MSSATVNSECNLLLLWPTAFRQRSLASLAWRCGLLLPRGLSSSIASPRNMSAARRAHVSRTWARSSAPKASISNRLNGAPRLNCRMRLVSREARVADLIIVGARHTGGNMQDLADPGVILLRAGRPVLVVPDTVAPLQLRRVVVAWKDTRECRRAVRDALPFLQRAKEVLLVGIGEGEAEANAKRNLSDAAGYLLRHRVAAVHDVWRQARGPVAAELLRLVQDEGADLIVAGGYGHSRLGEWIFGGVTHELLVLSPVCCMLSH